MNRKEFIIESCAACIAATGISSLLSSCSPTQYISGMLGKDGITINKNDFRLSQKDNAAYRSFVIVRNEALQYPICVYRFGDEQYSALWMRCTHQGTELNASGDFLQCPAHGSEFNNKGMVRNGPADKDLRAFPVVISNDDLFIDLRKQS
jgi:Rieske Fe-S protein